MDTFTLPALARYWYQVPRVLVAASSQLAKIKRDWGKWLIQANRRRTSRRNCEKPSRRFSHRTHSYGNRAWNTPQYDPSLLGCRWEQGKGRHNNDNDYHQCNFYNNLVSRFPHMGWEWWEAIGLADLYAHRTRFGCRFKILDANNMRQNRDKNGLNERIKDLRRKRGGRRAEGPSINYSYTP